MGDSDFFTFNPPSYPGGFITYGATLGSTALNINGIALATSDGIWQDGLLFGGAPGSQFFALNFSSDVPVTGLATAGGSAIVKIAFSDLPYAAGSSVDVVGNGKLLFNFGNQVPDGGSTLAMLGVALTGLAGFRRRLASV